MFSWKLVLEGEMLGSLNPKGTTCIHSFPSLPIPNLDSSLVCGLWPRGPHQQIPVFSVIYDYGYNYCCGDDHLFIQPHGHDSFYTTCSTVDNLIFGLCTILLFLFIK